MATLTKIFTGMTGGPEAIQSNFAALNGDLAKLQLNTAFTNSTIVWVNGYRADPAQGLQYSVVGIGNGRYLTQIIGGINMDNDLSNWSTVQALKWDGTKVFPGGFSMSHYGALDIAVGNGAGHAQLRIDGAGISIRALGSDIKAASNGIDVNALFLSGK